MSGIESSIPAVLAERAQQQPDDIAFTFIDYEVDPTGFAERLTWSQVYRRASVVAAELSLCGSVGDRAAILAPHGLDYIVAFLGAIQAGFIAVPLPVPQFGTLDERASGALRDSSPVAILTTSAVVDDVMPYSGAQPGKRAPGLIEIDALGLDSPRMLDANICPHTNTAYLQYTSGSTRQPAGVVISHRNLIANLEQMMSDYFEDYGKVPPPDTTLVSWLPFYHDMGLILGVCAPMMAGRPAVLMSAMSFLQKPARWMQLLASNSCSFSGGPNFAFEVAARRTSDDDMAGLDLGDVLAIGSGSERVHAATIRRFTERFSRFNLPVPRCVRRTGSRRRRCTWRHPPRDSYRRRSVSTTRSCRPATQSVAEAMADRSWSATVHPGRRRCASSTPTPGSRIPPGRSGRSGCTAITSRTATGETCNRPSERRSQARQSVAGHAGRTVAAHRRPGRHFPG